MMQVWEKIVAKVSAKFCHCWTFVTDLSVDIGSANPLLEPIFLPQSKLAAPPTSQRKARLWHSGCYSGGWSKLVHPEQ